METCAYCGLPGGLMQSIGTEGLMVHRPSKCLELLKAEIERLRRERAAAIRLLKNRDRLDWGWNRHQKVYGYYLDWRWVGVDLEDVVRAEAKLSEEIKGDVPGDPGGDAGER